MPIQNELNYSLDDIIEDLLFFIDNHRTFNGKLVDNIIKEYEDKGCVDPDKRIFLFKIWEKWRVAEFVKTKKRFIFDDEMI